LHRRDLHPSRFLHGDPPSPEDGQALLRIESFGLTSNYITYAVFGEAMNYGGLFPASDPDWGKLNVWATPTSRSRERAVYVDISGDGAVRAAVHARYGDHLAHSATVGATHWTQMTEGAGELAGPQPVFFFAPDRITMRGADWDTAKLDENVGEAWVPYAQWASGWLRVGRVSSEDDIQRAYLELLDGKGDPTAGPLFSSSPRRRWVTLERSARRATMGHGRSSG
jgi:Protein of unknown function (DUF2855)